MCHGRTQRRLVSPVVWETPGTGLVSSLLTSIVLLTSTRAQPRSFLSFSLWDTHMCRHTHKQILALCCSPSYWLVCYELGSTHSEAALPLNSKIQTGKLHSKQRWKKWKLTVKCCLQFPLEEKKKYINTMSPACHLTHRGFHQSIRPISTACCA